ncbi:MAG: SOS response-associated peptidase [Desulfatibacillum sp.]|nr:SOS response-associated peptidase [Desulfatibacillum sp.]
MCGRFLQFWFDETIISSLGVKGYPHNFTPSYNIAPTQKAWIILDDGAPRLEAFSWGLVPSWAKDTQGGSRLINARSETAAEKPSFRSAFTTRRCLVPANGFYEWTGTTGGKQPHFCTATPKAMMAFAGLWEKWQPANTEERNTPVSAHYSFTILTREASPSFASIHHRMPVILSPRAYVQWLNPQKTNPGQLKEILETRYLGEMETYPVSKAVNSPSHNGPDCMEPITLPGMEKPIQQSLF